MGYNAFRWYTKGRRVKPLKKSEPLLLRIQNGDYEYSPYFSEAKEVEKEGDKTVSYTHLTLPTICSV